MSVCVCENKTHVFMLYLGIGDFLLLFEKLISLPHKPSESVLNLKMSLKKKLYFSKYTAYKHSCIWPLSNKSSSKAAIQCQIHCSIVFDVSIEAKLQSLNLFITRKACRSLKCVNTSISRLNSLQILH